MNAFRTIIPLLAVMLIGCAAAGNSYAASKRQDEPIRLVLTVRAGSHTTLSSSLAIDSAELKRGILHGEQHNAMVPDLYSDIEVSVQRAASEETHYLLDRGGLLWNEAQRMSLRLPAHASSKLLALAEALRTQFYGSKLTWDEAKRLMPNKSIFSVTDLESGLTFRVQRRAGSDHADVQPLSKADTSVMKQIFSGHWTWNRRAILVHTDRQWIAASMNGMPHGGDGIPDNDFSGHFCIHFFKSTTHKSDTPDLAHQLMVHKSAGQLRPMLDAASPTELAHSYIEALNHHDEIVLRHVASGWTASQLRGALQGMEDIASIRALSQKRKSGTLEPSANEYGSQLSAELVVPVAVLKQNQSKRNTAYTFRLHRASAQSPWRLQDVTAG